mmetsp:Transcript_4648/g.6668  ORF Transcript_4648/g.6668 Transcript_4648/m.6668 type:complete len:122 (+) Transcript_4648:770-1135(+)
MKGHQEIYPEHGIRAYTPRPVSSLPDHQKSSSASGQWEPLQLTGRSSFFAMLNNPFEEVYREGDGPEQYVHQFESDMTQQTEAGICVSFHHYQPCQFFELTVGHQCDVSRQLWIQNGLVLR